MKYIKGILILTVLTTINCGAKTFDNLSWQGKQVTIDGQSNDWNIPLRYFDNASQLNYTITYDNEYIYFAARTTDKTTLMQIMTGGIKLEIDTVKKSKNYQWSVKYPVMEQRRMHDGPPMHDNMTDEASGNMPPMPPGDDMERRDPFQNRMEKAELSGFNESSEPETVTIDAKSKIKIKYRIDSLEVLFYELAIPIASIFPLPRTTEVEKLLNIKINIEESNFPFMMGPPDGDTPRVGNGQNGPPGGVGNPGGSPSGMGRQNMSGGPGGPGGGGPGGPGTPPSMSSESEKCEIIERFNITLNPTMP